MFKNVGVQTKNKGIVFVEANKAQETGGFRAIAETNTVPYSQ
jgi:hypothetical protein